LAGVLFSLKQSLASIEACVVSRALAKFSGCQSKTAQLLGTTDRSIRHLQEKSMHIIIVIVSTSIIDTFSDFSNLMLDLFFLFAIPS
jgi:hypothetical protein